MGAKQQKALSSLKKASSQLSIPNDMKEAADFLPLEGGPAHKLSEEKTPVNKATVLYIGRIPHRVYEKEMQAFFGQFGVIKRLRRNKKVAEVVADTMHSYLLLEHLLQVHLIPPKHVHAKLWKAFNYCHKPLDRVQVEQRQQNKERTLEERRKLVEKILKRDQKQCKRIEDADRLLLA